MNNNLRELKKFQEFGKKEEKFCEPVVIRRVNELAEVLNRWNLSYLCSLLGSKIVVVSESRDGIHRLNTKTGKINSTTMPFSEYIERLQSKTEQESSLYLQQMPIKTMCPGLLGDFDFILKYIKELKNFSMNLWIGPKNAISPLHFDFDNNFLIQLNGSKKLRLYAPNQSKYLYPRPFFLNFNHISNINMEEPCLKRFPKYYKAIPLEVTLYAGDILYIPPFWWHKAYGLSTNISTNVWWPSRLNQYPVQLFAHGLAFFLRDACILIRQKVCCLGGRLKENSPPPN